MPVTPILRRWRQEGQGVKGSHVSSWRPAWTAEALLQQQEVSFSCPFIKGPHSFNLCGPLNRLLALKCLLNECYPAAHAVVSYIRCYHWGAEASSLSHLCRTPVRKWERQVRLSPLQTRLLPEFAVRVPAEPSLGSISSGGTVTSKLIFFL